MKTYSAKPADIRRDWYVVDGTDQVLWIAVSGTFAGRTPQGIGLGSTRAAVVRGKGPSEFPSR